jgi:hypothetical protein
MQLGWSEIRRRAMDFSREWAGETREHAEAKSFWEGFFTVFGISRRRLASFEVPVKLRDKHNGFIDLLWKGVLLVESKSAGEDLDAAYIQGINYFEGIAERDLPRYVMVSNFQSLRLYDLQHSADAEPYVEFPLAELHRHVRLFSIMARFGGVNGVQTNGGPGVWVRMCKRHSTAARIHLRPHNVDPNVLLRGALKYLWPVGIVGGKVEVRVSVEVAHNRKIP